MEIVNRWPAGVMGIIPLPIPTDWVDHSALDRSFYILSFPYTILSSVHMEHEWHLTISIDDRSCRW